MVYLCENIREADDQSWSTRKSEDQNWNIRQSEDQIFSVPRHEKLWVWQKSHNLRLRIHQICAGLPRDEKYRLRDQIERSSNSVADNIAEGNSSYYFNDKIKGFYIARKEAGETQNHLRHLESKRYITVKEANSIIYCYEEIIRGINGLVNRVKRKRDYTRLKGNRTV